MPRPRKCRKVCRLPDNVLFGPVGPKYPLGVPVVLQVEEYEAVRLIDHEGMTQEECAEKMHIARTTVQAIYTIARKKLADLLVNGKRLLIEGGDYRLCEGGPMCDKGCCRHFENGQRPCDRGGPGCLEGAKSNGTGKSVKGKRIYLGSLQKTEKIVR